MKKLFALCAALCLSLLVSYAQIEVGSGYVNGLAYSVSRASDGYESIATAGFDGFYTKLMQAKPLGTIFMLKYGLCYNYLSGNDSNFLYITGDPHYNIIKRAGSVVSYEHYLNIPIMAGLSKALTKKLGIFLYAGPNISCALSSKSYSSWPGVQCVNYWNVDHFAKDTNYSGNCRINVGIGGNIGAYFNRFSLELGGCLRHNYVAFYLGLNYFLSSSFEKNFHWKSTK